MWTAKHTFILLEQERNNLLKPRTVNIIFFTMFKTHMLWFESEIASKDSWFELQAYGSFLRSEEHLQSWFWQRQLIRCRPFQGCTSFWFCLASLILLCTAGTRCHLTRLLQWRCGFSALSSSQWLAELLGKDELLFLRIACAKHFVTSKLPNRDVKEIANHGVDFLSEANAGTIIALMRWGFDFVYCKYVQRFISRASITNLWWSGSRYTFWNVIFHCLVSASNINLIILDIASTF